MAFIFQGDDTGAFNNTFLTIRANIPEGFIVSKAKVKIGDLPIMTFDNPEFPIRINLTSAQTRQLKTQNECYMAIYDSVGRKKTCNGTIKFVAKDEVIR